MSKYDDILYLDRPVSKNHPQMSIYDRSAQFAPFAALVGYDEAIKEQARMVDSKVELGIDKVEEINKAIAFLSINEDSHPSITITYFLKDKVKNGGKYFSYSGRLKRIDTIEKELVFSNKKIKFKDIIDIVINEHE